jgi:hypothetical protein
MAGPRGARSGSRARDAAASPERDDPIDQRDTAGADTASTLGKGTAARTPSSAGATIAGADSALSCTDSLPSRPPVHIHSRGPARPPLIPPPSSPLPNCLPTLPPPQDDSPEAFQTGIGERIAHGRGPKIGTKKATVDRRLTGIRLSAKPWRSCEDRLGLWPQTGRQASRGQARAPHAAPPPAQTGFRPPAQAKPGAGYLLGCGVWQEILGFTPM